MFSPETPQPTKYRRKKSAPKEDGPDLWWLKRIFQILFILLGIAAIAAIIHFSPDKKELVCDKSAGGRNSLIGFGSCTTK